MSGLRIPAALSATSKLVLPNVVKSDGPFSCVGCRERLTLRQGAVRTPHFAHRSTSQCSGGEGILHKATKLWFVNAVNQNLDVAISAKCMRCNDEHTVWKVSSPCRAMDEVPLRVAGRVKYRIDSAIIGLEDERMLAAVEIFHTHRIGPEKRGFIEKLAPVFEVVAVNPAATDFSTTFMCADQVGHCPRCSALLEEAARVAAARAERAARAAERTARLTVLCITVKAIGCLKPALFRYRARTLCQRLDMVLMTCWCGKRCDTTAHTLNGCGLPVCAKCTVYCNRCNKNYDRGYIDELFDSADMICKSCVYDATLIECRICGDRAVDPTDTQRWIRDCVYRICCPGLCSTCEVRRTVDVKIPDAGKSKKRKCSKCDQTWGTMFHDIMPVKRPCQNSYGLEYDWACRSCRIECSDCGVYCFDYGGRCLVCNESRPRKRKAVESAIRFFL